MNALIERYYLGPVLIGWTWLAMLGAGLATVAGISIDGQRRPDRVIATALAVLLLVPTVAAAPSRLDSLDRSGDVAARLWIEHALGVMREDAVIVSWWSYSTPLWYAQLVEDRRPDIDIIDDRTRLDRNLGDIYDVIDANLPTRPVYVIRIEPSEIEGLKERYVLDVIGGTEATVLTRIIGSRETRRMTDAAGPTARVARLSYFFPAHNEEANIEGLVEEALESPPGARRDVRDHRRQ